MRDISVRNAKAANDRPKPIGYCHFCMEPIAAAAENKIFCDADCAHDWEHERTVDKRSGHKP